jgi:hypothetical protein
VGQTNKIRPFSSYKAYNRAIVRLDAKFEHKYPVIRLPRPPKGYKRIWETAWAEYDKERQELQSRLPLEDDPDFPDEPMPISPYEIEVTPEHPYGTRYKRDHDGKAYLKDRTKEMFDFYENNHPWAVVYRPSRSGGNPLCKTCKKMSVYRKGDPEEPPIPNSLWDNEIVTFQKFKYRDYCSDECKREAHNKRRLKEKEKRMCPYCHAEYTGRGKTCSKSACRKQAFRKMKKDHYD